MCFLRALVDELFFFIIFFISIERMSYCSVLMESRCSSSWFLFMIVAGSLFGFHISFLLRWTQLRTYLYVIGCYSLDSDGESVFFFTPFVYDRCWIFIPFSFIFLFLIDTADDVYFCNWMLFAGF